MQRIFIGLLCGLFGTTAFAQAPARPTTKPAKVAEAPPAMEEIQKTFDAKDYAGTLQLMLQVQNLKKEDAAKDYDRYTLQILKAESHLQLKQAKAASEAFAAAAKATDDDMKAAVARAMQRLVNDSKGLKVTRKSTRKGAEPASVDLLDLDKRSEAFNLAYADARAAAEPVVKAAMRARTLPPIAEGLQMLDGVADLEMAATGGVAVDVATRLDLGQRAAELIEKEFDRMANDIEDIRSAADTPIRERIAVRSTQVATTYRGLSSRDRADLKTIIDTCLKIIPTAESLTRATGGRPDQADLLIERAKDIAQSADRTLKTRY